MGKGCGVNTIEQETHPSSPFRRLTGRLPVRLGVGLGLILVLSVVAYAVWLRGGTDQPDIPLYTVRRGPLVISVSESGTIQSRDQAVVKSEVEGKAVILSLIPEGTVVTKGQLLVELDTSRLEDEKTQQQITVLNAEAAYIRARENLAVTKSQSDSDVAGAELAYRFAELDLKKYTQGEYPQQLQQADAEITIAKEELQRASDKLDWSKRLAAEGYITRMELQADELAAKRSQLNLELAQGKRKLLEEYTHQRSLQQLQSDVVQALKALERVKRKAAADVVQAEADLKAKESEFNRQKTKLDKIVQQIAKCKITAPVAGMVVYATTGKASFRGNVEPLQEGQEIRERQDLIYLPTTSSMMAEAKIHESSLRKVQRGMPVRVTVDAMPGRVFTGSVGSIGLLPDAQSAWMNPDLKVYTTEILLDAGASDLRTGMTCRAEILVESYGETMFVPVYSVLRVGGKTVVYVQGPRGPERREVEAGLDNNRMIRIIRGLSEGEQVLLAPPLGQSAVSEESERPAHGTVPSPAVPTTAPAPGPEGGAATPQRSPAAPLAATSRPALDPSRLRDMTGEQRKKFFEGLSPQEREKLRKQRTGSGSGRQGDGGGPPGSGGRRP